MHIGLTYFESTHNLIPTKYSNLGILEIYIPCKMIIYSPNPKPPRNNQNITSTEVIIPNCRQEQRDIQEEKDKDYYHNSITIQDDLPCEIEDAIRRQGQTQRGI